tara:strand:- start:4503 stop:6398 length:1896 start_codon:yes stop_codon:yes gene_type:complete
VKKYLSILLFPTVTFANNLSPDGMTQVMSGVDDKAVSVEMGHTFPWLDQVFTHAWMSTNGFVLMYNPTTGIGRQTAPPSGYCCDGYTHGTGMPTYMPNTYGLGSFSYMLAPLWTDLDDTSADTDAGYFYKTDSDSTSFLWNKVRQYATTNENTFGLTLDRTGGFKFEYQDVNVSFHHKAFVGWYGGPNFPNGDGYGGSWTQEWEMNGFTTNDVQNYDGSTTFELNNGVASLIMSASTLNQQQGGGGGEAASAPPSYAEQAADTVFGDSADDFMHLDQPDAMGRPRALTQLAQPQVYQDAPQEQMFGGPQIMGRAPTGEPVRQDQQQQRQAPEITGEPAQVEEVREARPVEVVEAVAEVVQVTREPRPEPAPERVVIRAEPVVREAQVVETQAKAAPVEVAAETRAEPAAERVSAAVKPAVDVVGIALSLSGQSQSFGSQTQNMGIFDDTGPDQTVVSMQQQITQTVTTQADQQESNGLTQEDLAPPSQMQFEQDFNDAIATGQSIGQFLSAQLPDFSRFDVTPPSQQEQRTVQRAEAQIQSMSQQDVEQSLENELEELGDTGGFTDQSLAVFLISNNPAFNAYDNVSLTDREFYRSAQLYPSNSVQANPVGILRVTGNRKYSDLVDLQWQR